MKFKFELVHFFKAPITIITPGGEAQSFVATFLYLDDKANDEALKLGDAGLLRQVWQGWDDDIVDAEDKPLPFSEAQRELFLGHSFIRVAVAMQYVTARSGIREKN